MGLAAQEFEDLLRGAISSSGSGTPVQLTRGGSYAVESEDGRYLYFAAPQLAGIRRISIAPAGSVTSPSGLPEEEIIKETVAVSGHRFWALGQGGIYFVDPRTRPAQLKFVNLATRRVTVLSTLPKPPAKFTKGLAISPDGRFALYCQDDLDRYEMRVAENR